MDLEPPSLIFHRRKFSVPSEDWYLNARVTTWRIYNFDRTEHTTLTYAKIRLAARPERIKPILARQLKSGMCLKIISCLELPVWHHSRFNSRINIAHGYHQCVRGKDP